MKYLPLVIITIMLCGCERPAGNTKAMQLQIDSLQNKLANTYKPGLGEFMAGIQLHHAKLWFAGTNNNWPLADFELQEIKEAVEDIEKYNTDRPEVKSLSMLMPALDSAQFAVNKANLPDFKRSYLLLTNTCNTCHVATNHAFNVITVPAVPPVSNQNFKPQAGSNTSGK